MNVWKDFSQLASTKSRFDVCNKSWKMWCLPLRQLGNLRGQLGNFSSATRTSHEFAYSILGKMTSTSHKQYVDVMAGDGKKGHFYYVPKEVKFPHISTTWSKQIQVCLGEAGFLILQPVRNGGSTNRIWWYQKDTQTHAPLPWGRSWFDCFVFRQCWQEQRGI